eukprot:1090314-Alexandrium_andersonii.AAC.1
MSASLVGSEMCIRDRLNCATLLAAEQDKLTPARIGRGARAPGCGRIPVSYTHLTLPTICSV